MNRGWAWARVFGSPAFAVCTAFVGTFALGVVGTAADGWPLPRAFDEFSYLLAGETFAGGRLTNSAYAFPDAIETIHVINEPTYSSKYLPGHALFLAVGNLLGGGPRLGQWIAFAAMGAAIFWLLRAWLSTQAASITTGLFVLALADTEWASGFWGSSAAVAGSALIFGVLPRLQRGPRVHLGLLLGAGVVLLALTRPLEGLAVSIVPALYMIWWLLKRGEWRRRLLRVALPCIAVLALGSGFLAAHNKAVTGSATKLAYAHYEDSAPGAPPFIWQAPNEPTDRIRTNERVRLSIDLGSYHGMREDWAAGMWLRATSQALPYYFPHVIFALVFLVIPLAFRDKRLWLLAASAAAVGAAISVSSFFLPHYVGPALPPLLVLYAIGCGVLTRFRVRQQRVGRAAVAGLSITLALCGVWRLFALTPLERAMTRSQYWTRQRDFIAQELKETQEQHLVFVRYDSTYQSQNEWVQNSADLTSAPVLWVHDLGDSTNAKVRDYEARRKAWIVTVYGGARLPELSPYHGHVATSR